MTRQTSLLAARRLQSSKALVAELRGEMEVAEEGRRWVEVGGWEERLAGREGRRICEGVVGGFEDVCRGWRERLVERAGGGVEVGAG